MAAYYWQDYNADDFDGNSSAERIVRGPEWQDPEKFPCKKAANESTAARAPAELIGALNSFAIVPHDGDCPICTESMTAAVNTPCGHKFHRACLLNWFGVNHSCPACRRSLKPNVTHSGEVKICTICTDEHHEEIFLSCGCEHEYCEGCLERYFATEIGQKGLTTITCPSPACQQEADLTIIKRCCKPQDFLKYEKWQFRRVLTGMAEFRWCTNHTNGCGYGQVHEGGEGNNIVTCHSCRWKSCFTHTEQWHAGLTCAEYDLWKDAVAQTASGNAADEARATQAWLDQFTRQCPECTAIVYKKGTDDADDEECNHMTCTNVRTDGKECGHEFCWHCLGPYFGGDPTLHSRPTEREDPIREHWARYHNTVTGYVSLHGHHKPNCLLNG